MELGLSLGDSKKPFRFVEKPREQRFSHKGLSFCMGLSIAQVSYTRPQEDQSEEIKTQKQQDQTDREYDQNLQIISLQSPIQFDLLPHSALISRKPPDRSYQHFPWPSENGSPESGAGNELGEAELRGSPRVSDDEENGSARKKLRLSKEQSAFLEESFKEHYTLNPKQKLALAKQLNLRPRQVEVWFQNRRARTKLKQTEADCEYMKKWCETLREENRRLQKEVHELRALKTSNSLYNQLPPTTLTMCPSCERLAATATAPKTTSDTISKPPGLGFPFSRPSSYS